MTDTNDPIMTLAEWARFMGWKSAGMAHQALKEGRLVLAPDGKNVLAQASRELYAETASAPSADGANLGLQKARAMKEGYQALNAKLEYETAIGKVRDAAEVESLAASAAAELRQRMESIAPVLAPQLASLTDEGAIRARIHQEIELALEAAATHFRRLAAITPPPGHADAAA